jgi:hypothetical protein
MYLKQRMIIVARPLHSLNTARQRSFLESLKKALATLDGVLQIIAEDEPKDFEFILDIETRMVVVMRALGRVEEANEVERRLVAVREALGEDEIISS